MESQPIYSLKTMPIQNLSSQMTAVMVSCYEKSQVKSILISYCIVFPRKLILFLLGRFSGVNSEVM